MEARREDLFLPRNCQVKLCTQIIQLPSSTCVSYCRNIFTAEDPVDSANIQMLSNNYVLSVQCYLTKEQKMKIDALIEKTQPKFTVLVVQMKKSNVKQHATLVRKFCHLHFV